MSKKKQYIFIIIGLVIIIAMGAGFYILFNKLSSLDMKSNENATVSSEKNDDDNNMGVLYPLDTFIVNLADQGGRRYLRVKMDLELKKQENSDELTKKIPMIRDAVLKLLPAKSMKDIHSVAGKNALHDEIIIKLNGLLKKEIVTNIYFTEFVIQ
ncbi:MAG: flagellar basal body-associated FliL family protein [Deltaproteobacteria bacterium]|nr:flagellar basal body-associated FliL family protein [Deltaproteobacteria bacterium]